MFTTDLIAAAVPSVAHHVRRWIFGLGGLGFIPLGLIDSSFIPVPGSMDVLLIVLAARHSELWLYYAMMATVGAVGGGYLTYRLARKGGKKALERRFSPRTLKRIYRIFEKWGFAAIAVPALLPPPVPMVPFLLAAGAMQYSVKKFLMALTLGRAARYLILGYLADRYGESMLAFLSRHEHPVVFGVAGVIVAGVAVYFFIRGIKKRKKNKNKRKA
ncbi:MAG: YqaA family protein [Candidatus Acidiferrum sp.]